MAQLQVPKDYVRKQLYSMGIQDISEGDLESYTRGETQKYSLFDECSSYHIKLPFADFSRLIQERLQHEDSAELSSTNSSLASTPVYPPPTSSMHTRGDTLLHSGMPRCLEM